MADDDSTQVSESAVEEYVPTAEDFEPSPKRPPSPLSRLPPFGEALPAIACLALSATATFAYLYTDYGRALVASGDLVFAKYEVWRLVTSLFVHSGAAHLGSNSLLFFIFGWALHAFFGFWIFPVLCFVLGAITQGITIATYEPNVQLIGASGVVHVAVGLWLALFILLETEISPRKKCIRVSGFVLGVLVPDTFVPSTSYMAHAVGFGLGFAAGILLGKLFGSRILNDPQLAVAELGNSR